MDRFKDQSGFTLVEVVIVLAITGLMVAGFLAGQSSRNSNTAFSTSVDQIKQVLAGYEAQAVEGIRTGPAVGNGDDTNNEVVGNMVQFTSPTSSYESYLVQLDLSSNPERYGEVSPVTQTLHQGLTFSGSSTAGPTGPFLGAGDAPAIVFLTHPQGNDTIYTVPSSAFSPTVTWNDPTNYGAASNVYTQVTYYQFTSSDGSEQAVIKVDPDNNSIVRCSQNATAC